MWSPDGPSRRGSHSGSAQQPRSERNAAAGTTMRHPSRSDGSTPVRASAYAVERDTPSTVAASLTVNVARPAAPSASPSSPSTILMTPLRERPARRSDTTRVAASGSPRSAASSPGLMLVDVIFLGENAVVDGLARRFAAATGMSRPGPSRTAVGRGQTRHLPSISTSRRALNVHRARWRPHRSSRHREQAAVVAVSRLRSPHRAGRRRGRCPCLATPPNEPSSVPTRHYAGGTGARSSGFRSGRPEWLDGPVLRPARQSSSSTMMNSPAP